MSDIAERVTRRVVKQWEATSEGTPPEIIPATTFAEIGFDSLDEVELVMDVEEEFDIELPDEPAQDCRTVGDLIALVERVMVVA